MGPGAQSPGASRGKTRRGGVGRGRGGSPGGREGAGPVRSTGQKQPAPGGLGEQMPGNISEAPTLSNQDQ